MSGPAKGHGGRPPLPPGKARPKVMSLRFTEEEYVAIEVAAGRLGVTPSEWARTAAIVALSRK